VELRKTVPVTCTTENNCVPYKNDLGIVTMPIKKQLSCDDTTPIKVTTGNAPNKLKVSNNIVEYAYAITCNEQGTINKINVLPSKTNLAPITIMVVDIIAAVKSRRLLKVSLDSGSTITLINKKCLPKHCKTRKTSHSRMVTTLAGSYNTSKMVTMRNLRLPELDKNRNIDQLKALVFESTTCKYDVILGADFLTKTGIDVKYSTNTIEWLDNELPLRDPHSLTDKDTLAMAEINDIHQEIELYGMDWYDPTCYATEILDAKYEKISTDYYVNQLHHLTTQQKKDLKKQY